MYHISWLTGAVLLAAPVWTAPVQAQDDAAGDVAEPAPSLLEIQPEDRVLGDPDAPVTIFEFASLTCPHCAAFHTDTLPELKQELIDTGMANLVMRHFPLDQLAMQAAMVADCVPDAQYYPFLNVLFDTQADWTSAENPLQAVLQTAMLAGAPRAELTACLEDEAVQTSVLSVRLRAQGELNVASTPTFFVGDTMLRGAQPFESFAEAVAVATAAAAAADDSAAEGDDAAGDDPVADDAGPEAADDADEATEADTDADADEPVTE